MKQFRSLKASLIAMLGAQAAGRFRTIGWPAQEQAAEQITGNNRTVQLYYESSELSSAAYGQVQHDVLYRVEMAVAADATADLTVLDDEDSTAGERAAALAAVLSSGQAADDAMDELIEIVFDILMAGYNCDLGMGPNVVANRWIRRMEKDQPIVDGELVISTGTIEFSARVAEDILGETPDVIAEPVQAGDITFNRDAVNTAHVQNGIEEVV